MKINKHLRDYILKNKIRYVATCTLQPGVAKGKFIPESEDHLINECNHV